MLPDYIEADTIWIPSIFLCLPEPVISSALRVFQEFIFPGQPPDYLILLFYNLLVSLFPGHLLDFVLYQFRRQ